MSESDKLLNRDLDRLLGTTPTEEPARPFRPFLSEQELALARRQGPSAKAEKSKYGDDLYKTSKDLEKQFQIKEAENVLEKLVIFDENSNCFEGTAAEHLFHLALNEERQGKLAEAEFHYKKGIEETKQERRQRLAENDFPIPRRQKGMPQQTDEDELDDVPRDMRKAENYAALARLANRRGFTQEASEFLRQAYIKDGSNAQYLKQAADPKNFNDLYFDWLHLYADQLLSK